MFVALRFSDVLSKFQLKLLFTLECLKRWYFTYDYNKRQKNVDLRASNKQRACSTFRRLFAIANTQRISETDWPRLLVYCARTTIGIIYAVFIRWRPLGSLDLTRYAFRFALGYVSMLLGQLSQVIARKNYCSQTLAHTRTHMHHTNTNYSETFTRDIQCSVFRHILFIYVIYVGIVECLGETRIFIRNT